MATRDLVVGTVFLLHTVIGVLGNFSLLYQYLFLHLTGCRLRPTDLIINNLIMANSSVLFSNGLTFTMTSFGWYHHLTDFMCRFYNYVRGVGRGVSIGTTCLLSIFQAITISPMNSRWAELKVKAPKYVTPLIFLYWILEMLVNVIFLMFMSSSLGIKNNTNVKSFGYCSSVRHKETEDALYAALLTSPDVLCFALMLWASGFMVFILYRHKQRVQHIHRACVSSGSSPESRATKSILLLVSTFVFLNTLSTIFHIFLATLNDPGWFVLTISEIFSLSFPSLSPFLIMSRDHRFSRLNFAWKRNMKSCNIMRNM
ncbi:PREDICTED: vomeronasal type-1 receptor 4 isoform X1 [Miniopterus natalensis]|uniref:vomeronasal type-1 receptor 4 isoform X1 n=1 Tax=Miniopterus natalensis TaxID=291302 RepID=UPI0007A728FB|nr:PREDICTED: vomeronasal type-1 receptor 4 isoform X1 [Miniopterus natalensis]